MMIVIFNIMIIIIKMLIILMPSQWVFLQLHNTLRQDTSPSQVSTVVKPSDCLVHRSWNIFGFNLIEQEDNNDDSDANDVAEVY